MHSELCTFQAALNVFTGHSAYIEIFPGKLLKIKENITFANCDVISLFNKRLPQPISAHPFCNTHYVSCGYF